MSRCNNKQLSMIYYFRIIIILFKIVVFFIYLFIFYFFFVIFCLYCLLFACVFYLIFFYFVLVFVFFFFVISTCLHLIRRKSINQFRKKPPLDRFAQSLTSQLVSHFLATMLRSRRKIEHKARWIKIIKNQHQPFMHFKSYES